MKKCSRGFTLMEVLIVVAIIAVLVAIAIPVFANQLEKSREAVDMANLRAVHAEVMTAANTDLGSRAGDNSVTNPADGVMWSGGENPYWYKTVAATQTQPGWQGPKPNIGGYTNVDGLVKGQKWQVKYSVKDGLSIEKAKGATG